MSLPPAADREDSLAGFEQTASVGHPLDTGPSLHIAAEQTPELSGRSPAEVWAHAAVARAQSLGESLASVAAAWEGAHAAKRGKPRF